MKLRIIGGDMRGRAVTYHGAAFTRPMRDSVRENLFNIVGRGARGTIAFDLFGGTGVLAFEALSRGSIRAVVVESKRPAIQQIEKTASHLGVEDRLRVLHADAFRIADELLAPPREGDDTAWLVFLSPPYKMWTDEADFPRLANMIRQVQKHAPPGSILVVETDITFDLEKLPAGDWDVRTYGQTHLAFLEPAITCGLNLPDQLEP